MEGNPKPSTVEWFVILHCMCIAHLAEPHPTSSVYQVAKKKRFKVYTRKPILNLVEGMTRIVAIAAAATG